jgi:hypothetical protein
MTTVNIPGPCPYCGGRKFARLTKLQMLPPATKVDTALYGTVEGGRVASLQAKSNAELLLNAIGLNVKATHQALLATGHYFALIMCTTCGKSDLFSQDPDALIAASREKAIIELPEPEAPYR